MFILTFRSEQGNFEEYYDIFGRSETSNVPTQYKTGIGMFQWLKPFGDDWQDGYCLGYQESMLETMSDPTFEAARGFAVFGVLMGLGVSLAAFSSGCLMYNWIQLSLLRFCLVVAAVATGLCMMMRQSSLCTTEFLDRSCDLDEGGLLIIAGIILWLVAFVISVVFLRAEGYRPTTAEDREKHQLSLQIAASRESQHSRTSSQSRASSRASSTGNAAATTPRTQRLHSLDSVESFRRSQERMERRKRDPVTVDDIGQSGDLEVYISRKLNNIDRMMEV